MINVEFEGEYDAQRNILFTKFINKPQTIEDVDYIISKNQHWYQQGGKNKVWIISDVSEMGMASAKLVSEYQKKEKPLNEKYVIDYCVICTKPLEKIAVYLFNILMGKKNPIFKTKEEAIEWVLKEQETKGRFVPL